MSTKKIKLFCILDGDSSAFEVKLDPDDSVATLKEAIKDKKPNDLQGLDADKLILIQVSIPSLPKRLVELNNLTAEEREQKPMELEDPTSEENHSHHFSITSIRQAN
ncbi:hypothetical protein BGZ76_002873 [Entomortierella beljakovae]|nr:hypothetical protein BGZ76_002873 [Entomortierella beljakovae]